MMYQPTQNINNSQSHEDNVPQRVNNKNYILCGRGKVNTKHPGNKIFAKIIESSINDYAEADSKMGKVIVVASVVDFIHGNGMKFVTYNAFTKNYDELSSQRIHTKVSHAIRDQIKQNKKADRPICGTSQARKQQKRQAAGPVNFPSTRESDKKDDGFDAWWSQHKNECCEKRMSHSATPSFVPSSTIEESPPCKTAFDNEGDYLTLSRTLFDLGAKIEESTFEMDIMYSLPMFPSPVSVQEEEEEDGCPLPVETEPEFDGEDVEKIFSLILDDIDEHDEKIELLPRLVNNEDFPDQCYSSSARML